MAMPMPERSIADLFTELSRDLSTLVRQEAALARTEMTGQLQAAGRDATMIGIGAVLGLTGLLAATAALILLLIHFNVVPWAAAAIVAFVMAAIGGVMVQSRLKAMRSRTMAPVETIESIKETAQWLKRETASTPTR
jgi:hypothetical protein